MLEIPVFTLEVGKGRVTRAVAELGSTVAAVC
jgi:hypothetical protein